MLVGGSGDDTYVASRQGVTVVMDVGDSGDNNTLVAKRIGVTRSTSFVIDIDNRHLLFGDTDSEQIVIALDWKKSRNRIRSLDLADGRYNTADIARQYRSFPNYLGNYSWRELENNVLDLNRVGLSSSSVNGAIQSIVNRADRLT